MTDTHSTNQKLRTPYQPLCGQWVWLNKSVVMSDSEKSYKGDQVVTYRFSVTGLYLYNTQYCALHCITLQYTMVVQYSTEQYSEF